MIKRKVVRQLHETLKRLNHIKPHLIPSLTKKRNTITTRRIY